MERNFEIKSSEVITHELPKSCMAQYLVVVIDRGMPCEINHFISIEEARRAFGEIAHDYGYEPNEINKSNHYDVSIWKWTEDRYKKVFTRIVENTK